MNELMKQNSITVLMAHPSPIQNSITDSVKGGEVHTARVVAVYTTNRGGEVQSRGIRTFHITSEPTSPIKTKTQVQTHLEVFPGHPIFLEKETKNEEVEFASDSELHGRRAGHDPSPSTEYGQYGLVRGRGVEQGGE